MENKIKKLVEYAKTIDITSFLIGLKNGEMLSIHYQNIQMKDIFVLCITIFHQMIDMEIKNNPTKPLAEVVALMDLKKSFDGIIKDHNKKVEELLSTKNCITCGLDQSSHPNTKCKEFKIKNYFKNDDYPDAKPGSDYMGAR